LSDLPRSSGRKRHCTPTRSMPMPHPRRSTRPGPRPAGLCPPGILAVGSLLSTRRARPDTICHPVFTTRDMIAGLNALIGGPTCARAGGGESVRDASTRNGVRPVRRAVRRPHPCGCASLTAASHVIAAVCAAAAARIHAVAAASAAAAARVAASASCSISAFLAVAIASTVRAYAVASRAAINAIAMSARACALALAVDRLKTSPRTNARSSPWRRRSPMT
jgi:hypothetical protein